MPANRNRSATVLILTMLTAHVALAGGSELAPRLDHAKALEAYNDGIRKVKLADCQALKASSAGRFGYAAARHEEPAQGYEQAVGDFTRAIALDPGLAQARASRGQAYLKLRRPAKAEAELVELRKVGSAMADALEHEIAAYWDLGRIGRKGDGC